MKFSPAFRRLLRLAALALAAFHLAFQLLVWVPAQWARDDPDRDVIVYYQAAERLQNGEPLYNPWPQFGPHEVPNRFFYPPPFTLLTRPLAEMSYLNFSRAWYVLVLIAFWIYAACLARIVMRRWAWPETLIAGLILQLTPEAAVALAFGNFEPVMWACYGLAVATPSKAAPLAFAAMMKLHPIWALAIVVRRGGWRALATAALILGIGFAAGIAFVGWENARMWWSATSPVVSQGTWWGGNVSISFAGIRVANALGFIHDVGPLPTLARMYLSAMALLGPLTAVYLTRHAKIEWRIALVGAATILFSPLCWTMYLPLLLLPAALFWRDKLATDDTD